VPGTEEPFQRRLRELGSERSLEWFLCADKTPTAAPQKAPRSFFEHVSIGHEFALVAKGRGRVRTRNEVFDLVPGQLLLIVPGIEHCEMPADPPQHYVMFWVHLERTWCRMNHVTYWPPTGHRLGAGMKLPGNTDVENIAAGIASEVSGREWGWERTVHGLLTYLVATLIRRIRRGTILRIPATASAGTADHSHVQRILQAVVEFCEANFRRQIKLSEVAGHIGYSPGHVSRLIRECLGCSFSDHLRGLRMNEAEKLLARSELGVAQIAWSLGYTEPAHFTRAFVRFTGLSPSDFRKHLR